MHLSSDDNTKLELKYIINRAESENSESILNYLDNDLGFELGKDLLEKDFTDYLGDTLHFGRSSIKHLYKQVKTIRPEIINPNIVDLYYLILNERDEDLLADQLSDAKKIRQKVLNALNKKYKNSDDPIYELSKNTTFQFTSDSETEIALYEFIEIFVDNQGPITATEAIILFDDINETSESAHKQARPKIECSKVHSYFSKEKTPKKSTPRTPDKSSKKSEPNTPEKSQIHKLEKSSKKYLPLIFNHFVKQCSVDSGDISKRLDKIYNEEEQTLDSEEIDQVTEEILAGKEKLRFLELYESIVSLSQRKPIELPDDKDLKSTFKKAIKEDPNFNPEKNKGFINSIVQEEEVTEGYPYMKYEWVHYFYSNAKPYQTWAQKYKNKIKEKSVPLTTVEDKEEDKEDPKDKKASGGALANLFGKKGKKDDQEEDDKENQGQNILNQLKGKLEVDFSKLIASNRASMKKKGSVKLSAEQREEFNQIMRGFIKNFDQIVPPEDPKKPGKHLKIFEDNISKVDKFYRQGDGSAQIDKMKKKYNYKEHRTATLDLFDLWTEIDNFKKFEIIEDKNHKYIFCFLKLDPETFSVNLQELEKFYVKTTKSNKKYKVEEMKEILTQLRDDLISAGSENKQNPDDSLHFESKVKIKGGVRYNVGSVEELIHRLVNYTKKNKDTDKSLLKIFEKYMDSQKEVDFEGLKKVLDEAGIKNTKKQINDLLLILDADKDVMLSYNELKNFLADYRTDKPIHSNLFAQLGGKGDKFKKLKEISDVNCDLKDTDYFLSDQYKSILNSDIAALKRVEQLLDEHEKSGRKDFIDLDFGPTDPDDEEGSRKALYTTGEAPPGYIKPEQIEWLYPEEMCEGSLKDGQKIEFLSDEASSNEVIQGALGDCWFIGALSVLASRDELLVGGVTQYQVNEDLQVTPLIAKTMSEGVYPPIFHGYAKHGIYVFRFFKNFNWRYVIIDQRIPCYKSNKNPVFGRCSELNELWVPLIEKAYAKLHRTYESLVSGFIDDALTDLTGFVAEKINLHNKHGMFPNKKLGTADEFWDYLEQRRKEESMLGCARKDETVEGQVIIDGEPTGILSRHAYGLLDIFKLESIENGEEFKLLRIRNPWGKTEWVGDWSDHSDEIEKYSKELASYVKGLEEDERFEIGEEDGTFIINYEDWSTIYNKLYVTIDFPPSWSGLRFMHEWTSETSGGLPMPSAKMKASEAAVSWAKNPQYLITQNKKEDIEFFFSLAQQDGRIEGKYKFPFSEVIHPVCLIIYKCDDGKPVDRFDGKKANPAWISTVVEHKEVSLRATLPKGQYLVVPSTREPGSVGDYFLNIYFNAEIHEIKIKNLKDSDDKGQEIKEEDEDVEVSTLRQKIVQTRLEDIYQNNPNHRTPRIFKKD